MNDFTATAAAPAPVVALLLSDVIGDHLDIIASGPTAPDPTTFHDALAILGRFDLLEKVPAAVLAHLRAGAAGRVRETPKPGDASLARVANRVIGNNTLVVEAAAAEARRLGYPPLILTSRLQGEAREVAAAQAAIARDLKAQGRRAVILSGGELTVTIRGSGRGGPNQEYALALAVALDGVPGIAALAGDTDGTDGGGGSPDDPAGAYVDGRSASRARARGLDPARSLADNNSTAFFADLGDLVTPGPTFTNVNDFRAIMVDDVDTP